ncbi:MAG: hypothetical protein HQL15_06410 [Candidatus Omnitrophica bacterium]|nr:hypothetical protein [Candidatus Omnitrophota bacterium]
MKFFSFILIMLLTLSGCVTEPPSTAGSLGFEDSRRVVVVGENIDSNIASYYQNKYDALVWFTPFKGKMENHVTNFFQNGLGSSVAMKGLIRELKSINYTIGKWEIIIPGIAEGYFLATLKDMQDHAMAKARGVIVLIDSTSNKNIEQQIQRVTDGNFFVSYEFHKE